MEIPENTVADLTRRLRRVEGQLRGIQQMLADDRDCRDIVTQMSAASAPINQISINGLRRRAENRPRRENQWSPAMSGSVGSFGVGVAMTAVDIGDSSVGLGAR